MNKRTNKPTNQQCNQPIYVIASLLERRAPPRFVFRGKQSPNLSPLCLQYAALPVRLYVYCILLSVQVERGWESPSYGRRRGGGGPSVLRLIYIIWYQCTYYLIHLCYVSVQPGPAKQLLFIRILNMIRT